MSCAAATVAGRGYDPQPSGYPQLRLCADTTDLVVPADATSRMLRRQLERWEHERDVSSFRADGLERLTDAQAFEYVHVFAGLRTLFPQVTVDAVDFCASPTVLGSAKGLAWSYAGTMPRAVVFAAEHDVYDVRAVVRHAEALGRRSVLREVRAVPGVADLRCTGRIALSEELAQPDGWAAIWSEHQTHARSLARRGLPDPWGKVAVSRRASYLVHEFAHLVEAQIMRQGDGDGLEPVYAALSQVLFGVRPTVAQWRYHLVNYPTVYEHRGPYEGGVRRRRSNRAALRRTIQEQIGTYATKDRTELFAEAFVLAYAGTSDQLDKYQPFRDELHRTLADGTA